MVLSLTAFEEAVIGAKNHILILDPHFDKIGIDVMEPALSISQADDVRLLTGRGDIDDEQRERQRRKFTRNMNKDRVEPGKVEVRWSASLDKHVFPFLHDRFAIVDVALWHFGSTVGGGHPGLTSASGPWSAAETRAKEFFEECWGLCNA